MVSRSYQFQKILLKELLVYFGANYINENSTEYHNRLKFNNVSLFKLELKLRRLMLFI